MAKQRPIAFLLIKAQRVNEPCKMILVMVKLLSATF